MAQLPERCRQIELDPILACIGEPDDVVVVAPMLDDSRPRPEPGRCSDSVRS